MSIPRIVKAMPFAFAITMISGVGGGAAIAGVIIVIIRILP